MTGEELRAWRKRMGWTKREAGRQLGVSVRALDYYEAGRRPEGRGAGAGGAGQPAITGAALGRSRARRH